MADIRNSKRLKLLADGLVTRCREGGVALFPDQAVGILADRVRTTAAGLRISERYTLDRYFDDASVAAMADNIISQVEENRRLADEAPSLTMSVADAAHVGAAFGIVIKIAAHHAGDADSLPLMNRAGDAVVLFCLEVAGSLTGEITLAGQDVVYPRIVLIQALDKLRSHEWSCICEADHETNQCSIQAGLVADLGRLGSWISEDAPPADARSPERMLRDAQNRFVESLGLDFDA